VRTGRRTALTPCLACSFRRRLPAYDRGPEGPLRRAQRRATGAAGAGALAAVAAGAAGASGAAGAAGALAAAGAAGEPMVIRSRLRSIVFRPMPLTRASSSALLNGPLALRWAT